MNRLRWSESAFDDLQRISRYIERHRDLTSANKVCRTIYDTVQLLRSFPESGKAGLEEGTRELVVPAFPAYIIVYRSAADRTVEVLRIWHGAQQREN